MLIQSHPRRPLANSSVGACQGHPFSEIDHSTKNPTLVRGASDKAPFTEDLTLCGCAERSMSEMSVLFTLDRQRCVCQLLRTYSSNLGGMGLGSVDGPHKEWFSAYRIAARNHTSLAAISFPVYPSIARGECLLSKIARFLFPEGQRHAN